MRVEHSVNNTSVSSNQNKNERTNGTEKTTEFDEIFKKERKDTTAVSKEKKIEKVNQIEELMKQVDKWQEEFQASPSADKLENYKSAVRDCLELFVQNEVVVQDKKISIGRRTKSVGFVKVVNEKLNTMTKDMLDRNEEQIKILKTMGEIKGMLYKKTV